ncbi:hypothetical protein GCM10023169_15990 [Georgenia halophila]|uniref:Uncharacterized protein n=1 Tax=Georgenia halophila TaxID=620889 RepID=A0ABP8L3N8_9MICO
MQRSLEREEPLDLASHRPGRAYGPPDDDLEIRPFRERDDDLMVPLTQLATIEPDCETHSYPFGARRCARR